MSDALRIPLGKGNGHALVDRSDAVLVAEYRWIIMRGNSGHIYASCGRVLMHRLIMGVPPRGLFVDHINRNGLDNRRSNLRLCSRAQNSANSKKRAGCSSQYKGVVQRHKKWSASIWQEVDGKRRCKHLGYFRDEIKAAIAYDNAALIQFGEFALLNFPNRKAA